MITPRISTSLLAAACLCITSLAATAQSTYGLRGALAGPGMLSAFGQVPLECTGAAPDVCPPLTVWVWAIPGNPVPAPNQPGKTMAAIQSCVTAFGYSALRIPSSKIGSSDKVTLTWTLVPIQIANADPRIDMSDITFKFIAPGIDVQDLSGGVTGSAVRFLKSRKVDDGQVKMGIYGPKTPGGALFIGAHEPRVQMQLPGVLTPIDCAPIDPIITNSD